MTKQRTLWTNRESKWKPRNLQAACVTFPARGLHLPPEEIKSPVFAPTHAEIVAAESAARRKRIAALEAEKPAAPQRQKTNPNKLHRKRHIKINFAAKQAKQIAKMQQRARDAQRS